MNGRNLLALACSGLSLLAATGCAREPEPRVSIKDTPVVNTGPTRVRGYVRHSDEAPSRATSGGAKAAVADPAAAPRAGTEIAAAAAPPANEAKAPPAPARIVNPPALPLEASGAAAVPPSPKAGEVPIREAAAGNVAPGAVPSINGSGTLTARIMEQARNRIAVGDVVRAREWLMSGLNGSRPEVLHELARTFDPNYLSRINNPNAVAEPTRARALYEEAVRLGVKAADEDLAALLKGMGGQP